MKPSDIKSLIAARFRSGIMRPLHIESSPGTGKTQIAAQAAHELGVEFKAIHAPLLQPEDYGFPVVDREKKDVSFVVSKDLFPVLSSPCAEQGILLIDELSQADNAAQKILANLIQERRIHNEILKRWLIVTTGNRTTDRAGANRLLSHLKNRLTTITLEASLDDWTTWALANAVRVEVISFLRFRPELLNAFDPQTDVSATPRAWVEGVSAALGVVDPSVEYDCFKGDVGEGAAAEFCGFLKLFRKLPNPDAILLAPKKHDVPDDPATLYALCGALVARTTPENFARVMEYVARMPAEFSVLFIRDVTKKDPALVNTREFITWASGAGKKLLS